MILSFQTGEPLTEDSLQMMVNFSGYLNLRKRIHACYKAPDGVLNPMKLLWNEHCPFCGLSQAGEKQ